MVNAEEAKKWVKENYPDIEGNDDEFYVRFYNARVLGVYTPPSYSLGLPFRKISELEEKKPAVIRAIPVYLEPKVSTVFLCGVCNKKRCFIQEHKNVEKKQVKLLNVEVVDSTGNINASMFNATPEVLNTFNAVLSDGKPSMSFLFKGYVNVYNEQKYFNFTEVIPLSGAESQEFIDFELFMDKNAARVIPIDESKLKNFFSNASPRFNELIKNVRFTRMNGGFLW